MRSLLLCFFRFATVTVRCRRCRSSWLAVEYACMAWEAGYAGAEPPKTAGSERDRTWLWLFGRTGARRPPSTGCAAGRAASGHVAGPRAARPWPSRVAPRRSAQRGSFFSEALAEPSEAKSLAALSSFLLVVVCKDSEPREKAATVRKAKARGRVANIQANYFLRNASTTNSSETPVSVFCTALSSGDRFACVRRGERR